MLTIDIISLYKAKPVSIFPAPSPTIVVSPKILEVIFNALVAPEMPYNESSIKISLWPTEPCTLPSLSFQTFPISFHLLLFDAASFTSESVILDIPLTLISYWINCTSKTTFAKIMTLAKVSNPSTSLVGSASAYPSFCACESASL